MRTFGSSTTACARICLPKRSIGSSHDGDDPAFFSLAASVLDWGWHSRDDRDVRIYAEQAGLEDFTRVALPQGLVASGFFANVVLLPFDEALREAIGTKIASGILLVGRVPVR